MILILFSWIYSAFITLNLGLLFNKIAKLKSICFITTIFLGTFLLTILASFWAFFGRIHFEFHLFILLLIVFNYIKFKADFLAICREFYDQIQLISKPLRYFLLALLFFIVLKSASSSSYIDNETYYIQSIKWLNEYGFVKGLANLHIFLGQMSGWHITQSALNLSFLTSNFNDCNGFLLFITNVYAVLKLNQVNNLKSNLIIALLPLVNLFFFQFISAPSPDLAVYIFSLFLFYIFTKNYKKQTIDSFNLIIIFSLFIVYIKITAIPLLLLPLSLFVSNYKLIISKIRFSLVLSGLILFVLIAKNTILTGLPLFPTNCYAHLVTVDYSIPPEVLKFWFNSAKLYESTVTSFEFMNMSGLEIFIKWLLYSKIDSVFNTIIFLIILVSPLFLWKYKNKKSNWIIYFTMLIQLLLLFLSSPQYRFILNFVVFFGLLFISHFAKRKKIISLLFITSLFPIAFSVFITLYTDFNEMNSKKRRSFDILVFPNENSTIENSYKINKVGNLNYYSPANKPYIWITGNGKLPAINKKQIDYFIQKNGCVPQKRTSNIKDGFFTLQIKKD